MSDETQKLGRQAALFENFFVHDTVDDLALETMGPDGKFVGKSPRTEHLTRGQLSALRKNIQTRAKAPDGAGNHDTD